jgi:hypothetical protein
LKIKSLPLIIKHNELKTINQNQTKTMKKLLLFTLIIGLFAGCKKTETPCYVGVFGGNVNICSTLEPSVISSERVLTLFENGTGTLYLPSCPLQAKEDVRCNLSYEVKGDSIRLTLTSGQYVTNNVATSNLTIPVLALVGNSYIGGQSIMNKMECSDTNLKISKYTWVRRP